MARGALSSEQIAAVLARREREVEQLVARVPRTSSERHLQRVEVDVIVEVTLWTVAPLLPDEVRAVVERLLVGQETIWSRALLAATGVA